MPSKGLLEYTLNKLSGNLVTKRIPQKANEPGFDRDFGEKICSIVFQMCSLNRERYDDAVKDFVDFSYDFLVLQEELERTGRYRLSSYQDAKEKVYDNEELMSRRYLNGLLFSQAFWLNHHKIMRFFKSQFCATSPESGNVLEVPVGTGIYLSEFLNLHSNWRAVGCDISVSSINYARQVLRINSATAVQLLQDDFSRLSPQARFDRIICGELLEHLEDPVLLLKKLRDLLRKDGKVFLTTAVWAANIDHIYLFKSVSEVREMLSQEFRIDQDLVLTIFENADETREKTAVNYAAVLSCK